MGHQPSLCDDNSTMDNLESKSLIEVAISILNAGEADQKKRDLTLQAAEAWKSGKITRIVPEIAVQPPEEPARPSNVTIVAPQIAPKRGKGGTLQTRIAMMHALVHIENMAIDLAWDIIARYPHYNLPKEFYDDFVKIAEDEARHYNMLHTRLKDMGSYYGALSAHNGLWDCAKSTFDDVRARLAIEHVVQEGHGLDVTPKTISRFYSSGDAESGKVLEVILRDEVSHVTAGVKWFSFICQRNSEDPKEKFYDYVKTYFKGKLKPPFNKEARDAAGLPEEWYLPLSKPVVENAN